MATRAKTVVTAQAKTGASLSIRTPSRASSPARMAVLIQRAARSGRARKLQPSIRRSTPARARVAASSAGASGSVAPATEARCAASEALRGAATVAASPTGKTGTENVVAKSTPGVSASAESRQMIWSFGSSSEVAARPGGMAKSTGISVPAGPESWRSGGMRSSASHRVFSTTRRCLPEPVVFLCRQRRQRRRSPSATTRPGTSMTPPRWPPITPGSETGAKRARPYLRARMVR